MDLGALAATVVAMLSSGAYLLGVALFKVAANRMEPLHGSHPFKLARQMLITPIWYAGGFLAAAGLALQWIAMSSLSLPAAQPAFVSGLVPLLLFATVLLGERLTPREWGCVALAALATLLVALSSTGFGSAGQPPSPWVVVALTLPALSLPVAMFNFGELSPIGVHARRPTGVAYGLSIGILIGTAELAIKGWGDTIADLQFLRTPYPYLAVVAAALGLGIIMVGYQRCRVSIVTTVMTISAKTYLLVVGTVLYGEPWPDAGQAVLRILALALAIYALLLFPRHDDRQRPAAAAEPAAAQRNADRAGAAQPPRPRAQLTHPRASTAPHTAPTAPNEKWVTRGKTGPCRMKPNVMPVTSATPRKKRGLATCARPPMSAGTHQPRPRAPARRKAASTRTAVSA